MGCRLGGYASVMDKIWAADLVDMQVFSRFN